MSSGNPKKGPPTGTVDAGPQKSPSAGAPAELKKQSGRVQFDDRGNAIWEWQIETGAFGREVSTQRLKKLENPGLSLADDAPTPFDKVKPNPLGAVTGYNPYDSGELGRTGVPKKKDLKKLSDWLALKKQVQNKKPDDE